VYNFPGERAVRFLVTGTKYKIRHAGHGPNYQNFDSQNQIDTFLLSVNFHFIAPEEEPNLGHTSIKVQIYYKYYVVRLCHKHNENKQEHKQDNKYLDDEPAIG
jgi:hypothetical protein